MRWRRALFAIALGVVAYLGLIPAIAIYASSHSATTSAATIVLTWMVIGVPVCLILAPALGLVLISMRLRGLERLAAVAAVVGLALIASDGDPAAAAVLSFGVGFYVVALEFLVQRYAPSRAARPPHVRQRLPNS